MSRILLVGKGDPDRGGIPTFLRQMLEGPLGRMHDVTFLNVAHTGVPEGGRWTSGNLVRTLRDAAALLRLAGSHDVVHVNSAVTPTTTVVRAGLLALAGRLRGAAVVVHVHGGNASQWLTRRRNRVVMKVAMWPAHRVVAVWEDGYSALSPVVGAGRLALVPNGIDTTVFTPHATLWNNPPRVLYVGLLTPRKGVLDLLTASQSLRENHVNHVAQLLGGTPDEGPDAARPVLEAAEGCASLLPTRPPEHMPVAYRDADIFCLPSWWEAMPMSILEAMASGLPVVASDVGDVARLVVDGHTGFVVPPQDPPALAAALRTLIDNPVTAQAMGAAGRRRVEEKFSDAATAEAISRVYSEALAQR